MQKILIVLLALTLCHATSAMAQSQSNIMKTKHDTARNSISNVR